MIQSSRAATENFVFLKATNNGSLKTNCCLESRARWNALAKKLACLKAGKRLLRSLAFWTNFFHFHQWGLHLFLRRKKQNHRACNAGQSQDGGFLEDLFAVCPEIWVALDTARLVTFLAEVLQKYTNFFLVKLPKRSIINVCYRIANLKKNRPTLIIGHFGNLSSRIAKYVLRLWSVYLASGQIKKR